MFQTQRRRLGAAALLAGASLGLMAGSAGAAPSANDCSSHLSDKQSGSLTLTSTTTGSVHPGSSVDVLATWTAPGWTEKATLLLCPTTDGALKTAASLAVPVVPDDGSSTVPFTVPADVPVGSDLCLRGVLVGHDSTSTEVTQTSNQLCFRTAAVSSPTTATTATTQAPPVVTPSVTDAPASTAGTSTPPALAQPEAPAAAAAPLAQPQLPRTGAPTGPLAAAGAAAVALGAVTRRIGRRRAIGVR